MSQTIVIIGGVAGGMSAATRARRLDEHARIIVYEKSGHVSFANCGLPYYIGGQITDEKKLLVTTPQLLRDRFAIEAHDHHEVRSIDRARKVVRGVDLPTGQSFEQPYDKLVLSPGASPIVPKIAHLDAPNVFLMRTMEDTRGLYNWIKDHSVRAATVVGAGFIGLEMVEALAARGIAVTLIEKAPHAMPPLDAELSPWLHQELRDHGVRLIVGAGLSALGMRDGRVSAAMTDDGQSIPTELLILCIGVVPNVQLARDAGLKIGAGGGIAVDEFQRTSDADIYAVGDAAEVVHRITGQAVRIPLAGPANRHGRAAGEHAVTGSSRPAGQVLGSAIVKVFELAVGMTGLSETNARRQGLEVDSAYVFPGHHAGFYPGASQLRMKMVYERGTGRVIGAQVLGRDGVDKRIDVIATLMHFGGTVDDLADLDLAYAPQFAAARDPVHQLAFVAQNQRAARTRAVAPHEYEDRARTIHHFVLDVREPSEFAAGALPGAVNIPLGVLRHRLGELPKDQDILIYCGVGQRGYVAHRLLQQRGFTRIHNLKGGYTLAMARR